MVTKYTNEELKLRFQTGVFVYVEGTGVSIARMDRGEHYTSPTERDANAKRFVQIWNLWPDVVDLLQDVANSADIPEMLRKNVQDMRKRIREEIS